MYKQGDYMMCKEQGAMRVTAVQDAGLTLCAVADEEVCIRLPADSPQLVRAAMDQKQAQQLIGRVPFIRTLQLPREDARLQAFGEALDSFEPASWVQVIKSVYLRKKERPVSETEEACARQARRYLHSELSCALGIAYDEIEPHITRAIDEDLYW